MITSKEIQTQFKEDLRKLLEKYNASIEIVDRGGDYVPNYQIEVGIGYVFQEDNLVSEGAVFCLGTYLYYDSLELT